MPDQLTRLQGQLEWIAAAGLRSGDRGFTYARLATDLKRMFSTAHRTRAAGGLFLEPVTTSGQWHVSLGINAAVEERLNDVAIRRLLDLHRVEGVAMIPFAHALDLGYFALAFVPMLWTGESAADAPNAYKNAAGIPVRTILTIAVAMLDPEDDSIELVPTMINSVPREAVFDREKTAEYVVTRSLDVRQSLVGNPVFARDSIERLPVIYTPISAAEQSPDKGRLFSAPRPMDTFPDAMAWLEYSTTIPWVIEQSLTAASWYEAVQHNPEAFTLDTLRPGEREMLHVQLPSGREMITLRTQAGATHTFRTNAPTDTIREIANLLSARYDLLAQGITLLDIRRDLGHRGHMLQIRSRDKDPNQSRVRATEAIATGQIGASRLP